MTTRTARPHVAALGALRRGVRPLLLAGLLACRGDGPAETPAPEPPLPAGMLLGADISALRRIEEAGGTFREDGQARDALAILRGRGSDLFRLRLFVDPNHQEVQVNDLDYTVALARRITTAGGKLLLDFHYSDTWADPGHQVTPAAWAALDFDALEQRVEAYSADVIARLKAAGVLPSMVQIGNEIDAGMLWPLGRVGGADDTPAQWDRLTRLLKAGVRGVRSALAPGDSVRIMLQYSQGGSAGGTQWFFDHIEARGVPYDLIGISYYPWWHGTLAALEANLRATASRYGRDVMVVETSYPWRAGGWEEMAANRAAMTWPISADGQARFLHDLLRTVAAVPDSRGLGVVWWYPEAIQVQGLFVWGGGSLSLFDPGGNPLPALSQLSSD